MCGICVADTSVHSSIAETPYARHPRGSIGLGISRGWTNRSSTITGADSKIDWSPPPPWLQCTTTFVPRSSWMITSSFAASSRSMTAGSSVAVTATTSAASIACSRVSATTTATASPLNRTLSDASGVVHRHLDVLGDRPHERQRAEVEVGRGVDTHDARHRCRFGGVDAIDRRVDVRRASERHPHHPRHRPVVDVARLSREELRVLLPQDRLPDERLRGRHRVPPHASAPAIEPAASRIDFTMFW